jgi:hypothetical protein
MPSFQNIDIIKKHEQALETFTQHYGRRGSDSPDGGKTNTSALSTLSANVFLIREIRDAGFDSSTNEKAIETVREGFEPSIPFWGMAL